MKKLHQILEKNTFDYQTPFGGVSLVFDGQILSHVHFCYEYMQQNHDVPEWVLPYFTFLDQYFNDGRKSSALPVKLSGTDFQKAVWEQIALIPAGETRTYQEIAQILNNHPRAVGQACGRNPVPLFIPCHRVVGKQGLRGFNLGTKEEALAVKRFLLQHEGVPL